MDFFRRNPGLFLAIMIEIAFLLAVLCNALGTPPRSLSVLPDAFDIAGLDGASLEPDGHLSIREDGAFPDGYSISAGPYGLYAGGYEVTVRYGSDADGSGGVDRSAAVVRFGPSSEAEDAGIYLDDAHTEVIGRTYSPYGASVGNFSVTIEYAGKGSLDLYSIELRESMAYRIMRLLGYTVLFVMIDLFAYAFLFRGGRLKYGLGTALALIGIILFSSLPAFADFLMYGHDLAFHLERIAAVAGELGNGQFPLRMMTDMCNGYGYANSLYYCDIFLYFPAVLYNFMLPLRTCYQIYVISVNAATCLIAYYAFGAMTGSRKQGLAGAGLYALAAYRLASVYVRAGVGEYTAMIFFPLIILGMYRIYISLKPSARDWLPLAIGMAGVVMSHALSVIIACASLLIFCLLHPIRMFRKHRLLALIKAASLCFLLTAWFAVPFLESMLLQDTRVSGYALNVQKYAAYPIQLFDLLPRGYGGNLAGIQGEMPLTLGASLILGMALILYAMFRREAWDLEDRPGFRACRDLFVMALICMAFSLRWFPWSWIQMNVPGLPVLVSVIQFPWRFLSAATAALIPAALFAIGEWRRHDRTAARTALLALCTAAFIGAGYFFHGYTDAADETSAVFASNLDTANVGYAEYLPASTTSLEEHYIVRTDLVSGNAGFGYDKSGGAGYLQVAYTGADGAEIAVPIFAYRNYEARDAASGEALPVFDGADGRLVIALPGGYSGTAEIRYVVPAYWHITEVVSVLSWAGLLAYAVRKRREATIEERARTGEAGDGNGDREYGDDD